MTYSEAWIAYLLVGLIGWLCWNTLFAWLIKWRLARRVVFAFGATIIFTPAPLLEGELLNDGWTHAPAIFPLILAVLGGNVADMGYLWPWFLQAFVLFLAALVLYHIALTLISSKRAARPPRGTH